MLRRNLQLLNKARTGDKASRVEVGKGYLSGSSGFYRNIKMGLEYLSSSGLSDGGIAIAIAHSLSLAEVIQFRQIDALRIAADFNDVKAQLKLGFWLLLHQPTFSEGVALLQQAHKDLHVDPTAFSNGVSPQGFANLLQRAQSIDHTAFSLSTDGFEIVMTATKETLASRDFTSFERCLKLAIYIRPGLDDDIAALVAEAIRLVEQSGTDFLKVPPEIVQACLERRCGKLDYSDAFILGRALCGLPCGPMEAAQIVKDTNYRKGAALLLRAADDGQDDAWLHLYRLHSNHETSIANTQMARFCLEKAAATGRVVAMRKLGATVLRDATLLVEWERGIALLFQASREGDQLSAQLLSTLVLEVDGGEAEARVTIAEVARIAPWLAVRIQLSRDFGLTKSEALTVDPLQGERAWGLVVGQNPFVTRLGSPRAIPAISSEILERLHTAARFFSQIKTDGYVVEGDMRQRGMTQRAVFARLHLDDATFFANANASVLDALKEGPKWGYRVRKLLTLAFSDDMDGPPPQLAFRSKRDGDGRLASAAADQVAD